MLKCHKPASSLHSSTLNAHNPMSHSSVFKTQTKIIQNREQEQNGKQGMGTWHNQMQQFNKHAKTTTINRQLKRWGTLYIRDKMTRANKGHVRVINHYSNKQE